MMSKMPVDIYVAIIRTVLAHWTYKNAIFESYISK